MDSYVVAACIAFIGVLVSIAGSYYTSARINKEIINAQKDIARISIDANLMAKARIDWIEKVRENTSNLISVLLTLQKEEKDFNLTWENGEKYSEILKLYFSSKTNNEVGKDIFIEGHILVVSEMAKKVLFNSESNENKNEYIIEYISCLMKMNRDDHYNNIKENLVASREKKNKNIQELFEIGKIEYEHDTFTIENGTVIETSNPISVNPKNNNSNRYIEIEEDIDRLEKMIATSIEKLKLLENSVVEFSSIISLYLKLEWDKAKQGK
ncbi:conserved hypothetical protein [Carnobacterium maltaromaticum]|uniref:hypothetical protein n=1 Tax=Carnobacterium maltaromaticum TaxID=2751 RepID=UPI0007054FF4|nr:hypothetical protein [Carnobacterium maltaromaticum]KRN72384.1 hypothetical protein IV76_GL002610 [Carnobacterium maltaromaticum]CRH18077.1 conserved hypothetical protein [Carnobacterium maltaromaticum]